MAIGIYRNGDYTFTVTVDDRYQIHTTVTADPAEVARWIDPIYRFNGLHDPLIGLDVEWRPAFGSYTNPVSVLQLCSGRRCLVFQIIHARPVYFPESLRRFLADARYIFLGVGITDDAQKLVNDYGLRVSSIIDLRTWAAERSGRAELRQVGLAALASIVMGIAVEKPQHVRLGRWDDPVLSVEQIKYACVDAFLSFEIGRMIRDNQWVR